MKGWKLDSTGAFGGSAISRQLSAKSEDKP